MTRRLLIVSTQMELGGVQVRAVELQKYFSARGVRTEIVFLYRKRDIGVDNPDISCLAERAPRTPASAIRLLMKLNRKVRSGNYDAILGFAHYSSPLATFLGRMAGIPVRVATQTNPPHKDKPGAVPLDRLCGNLGMYTANVAASQSIADCFEGYSAAYQRRLTVIHNGIRTLSPTIDRKSARARFGLGEDEVGLVTCGRLSAQKNQAFLLDVLQKLPPRFQLRIVGEGERRADLQQRIDALGLGNRARLMGEVPPSEMANFLIAGDIFLFPSRFEAFGLAMAEAMSQGLPVLCSDHPALVEVGKDAVISLPTISAEEWARKIEEVEAAPERRRTLSQRARQRAEEFTSETMCRRFYELMFGDVPGPLANDSGDA